MTNLNDNDDSDDDDDDNIENNIEDNNGGNFLNIKILLNIKYHYKYY